MKNLLDFRKRDFPASGFKLASNLRKKDRDACMGEENFEAALAFPLHSFLVFDVIGIVFGQFVRARF